MFKNEYEYRVLSGLTRVLVVLLVLDAIVQCICLVSSGMQLELLHRETYSQEEGEANDARERVVSVGYMGISFITVICFGIWIVRANRNVRALGARGLPYSPGWAVGYFFVPILNLFRPYQAMRDMLCASQSPERWRQAPGSPLLPLWWTLWLLTGVASQISARMLLAAKDRPALQMATTAEMLAEVLGIALSFSVIGLVLTVSRAQQTAAANTIPAGWRGDQETDQPDGGEDWRQRDRPEDDRFARGDQFSPNNR